MEIVSERQAKNSSLVERVTPFSEIRECSISGSKSVHARIDLMAGQVLSKFGAKEILDRPSYLTLQINQSQHIMLDPEWLQYINHSCDPNLFFNYEKGEAIVLKPIQAGEEIAFFYPSTEWSMDRAFDCHCKSWNCIGRIQGAEFLSSDILSNYQLSPYIQGMILEGI